MELMISIAVGVLLIEAYAWLPKISKWLLERAVRRVRAEEQERWREQWSADLDALPNTVVKLVYAVMNFSGYAVDSIKLIFLKQSVTN